MRRERPERNSKGTTVPGPDYETVRRLREHVVYHGLGDIYPYEEHMEPKELKPLDYGLIVLAGVKPSNVDEEIRNHPQVVIWDSQQQHWSNKDLPVNTRVVFVTRWIAHSNFDNIVKQARKRHITVFNPEGTGLIAKQVRQLLNIRKDGELVMTESTNGKNDTKETIMQTETTSSRKGIGVPKLAPLYQFIDFNKNNKANADFLMQKANELGITTTLGSLAQLVHVQRKKSGIPSPMTRSTHPTTKKARGDASLDVSVEILNQAISQLGDIRDFLVATVKENQKLRAKLDKFKKFFED